MNMKQLVGKPHILWLVPLKLTFL